MVVNELALNRDKKPFYTQRCWKQGHYAVIDLRTTQSQITLCEPLARLVFGSR